MSAPDSGAGPTHPPGHPGTGSPPPPPPPKDCDCGHGDLPQTFHLSPCPKARPQRLPTLEQHIDGPAQLLEHALFMLHRQWDPTSGPQQDGGVLPSEVDAALGAARTNIRIALLDLGDAADLISARRTSASLPGGPFNHPSGSSGEGLSPGLAVAGSAGQASARSDLAVVAQVAGSSHLTRTSPRVSGGRTPGLVDSSAPTDGSRAVAPGREAGDSSGPRPRTRTQSSADGAPEMTGAEPGAGFELPQAKRWSW